VSSALRSRKITSHQLSPPGGLLRMAALDAGTRQPVEDAELLLAQPLVDDQLRRLLGDSAD